MFRLLVVVATAAGVAVSSSLAWGGTPASATAASPRAPFDFVQATPGASDPALLAQRAPSMDDFSGHPAYAQFYQQRLTWNHQNCLRNSGKVTDLYECAVVTAPLDWYNPAKGTIELAISRLAGGATRPRADRLLLSNRGGPGGEGLIFGAQLGTVMKTTYHESVGVDPRGLGRSTQLLCPEVPEPADLPQGSDVAQWTLAETTAHVTHTTARMAACDSAPGSIHPYVSTDQTARDYNLVRAVLGYAAADYMGISYGSWVGAVLGRMFPRQFDRIVADSNADFASPTLKPMWTKYQPEAYQASLEKMILPWLARHHAKYNLGTTARDVNSTLATMRSVLRQVPAGRKYNRGTLDSLLILTVRQPGKLPLLGESLVQLRAAIAAGLPDDGAVTQSPSQNQPTHNVFDAIKCNDTGSWGTIATEVARVRTAEKNFPLQGQDSVDITCADWPRPPAIKPELAARPLHNVLMGQLEGDAATSYRGAFMARHQSRGTVRMVVADNHHGHGAYLNACVLSVEQAYLAGGHFPSTDLVCPASALPLDGTNVYEFGFPSSPTEILPRLLFHRTGDVVDPPLAGTPAISKPQRRASQAEHAAAQLAELSNDEDIWLGAATRHRASAPLALDAP